MRLLQLWGCVLDKDIGKEGSVAILMIKSASYREIVNLESCEYSWILNLYNKFLPALMYRLGVFEALTMFNKLDEYANWSDFDP